MKKKRAIGKIYKPKTMFFREGVGSAKSGSDEYEMSLNMGGSCPIICSKTTGKWWTIGWEDLIELAVEAGIDK